MNLIYLPLGLIWIGIVWLMLGHGPKMGAEDGDRPQDSHFQIAHRVFAYGVVIAAVTIGLLRRWMLETGDWQLWNGGFLKEILDFGAIAPNETTLLLGFGVFVFGFVLRVWSIRILGRLFTFEIGIRRNHELIIVGPYRLVRHPSYTGLILIFFGAAIAYASFGGAVFCVVATLFFFRHRVAAEEAMLEKEFGNTYREYSERTKRFIPFVF